ncbi:tRNA glutamyl-Q(34) synthetase GluQRS [Marinicellulosiphila megalodicopiae]|uniref:tRNA glutamyl-Q(34) synthetase GluQRS n=1 Tax=Marinicellulosiphila megalodicopiae TaxID=2724896 RepID=UPI003BB04CEA
MATQTKYIGRFAPTPTGYLHMGSLVAALASYLDAKANQGKWLVRIDDIDPPREVAGASDSILKCLERFGLNWDDSVVYQSKQNDKYEAYLAELAQNTYRCECSRKMIGSGLYAGTCFEKSIEPSKPTSVRLNVAGALVEFNDRIQSLQTEQASEDFVIKRKDNLWSYHLAVVVDDYLAGVTDVVRGIDLMDSTFNHIHLQKMLGFNQPSYAHIPVVIQANGQKLSKQNMAVPVGVNAKSVERELKLALSLLGISVEDAVNVKDVLDLAVKSWNIEKLKGIEVVSCNVGGVPLKG